MLVGFIILLILGGSATALYSRYVTDHHQQKKSALLQVRATLDKVWSFANIADMGYRGYALMKEDQFLEPYTKAAAEHQVYLDSLALYLDEQNYIQP